MTIELNGSPANPSDLAGLRADLGIVVGTSAFADRGVGAPGQAKIITDGPGGQPMVSLWNVVANDWLFNFGASGVFARCVADGVTNDTPALTAALTSLNLVTGNRGGTVYLPNGVSICNNWTVGDNITVQGAASPLTSGAGKGTHLTSTGGNSVIVHAGTTTAARRYNLTLRDLGILGSLAPNGDLVNVTRSSYFRAERCSFSNTTGRWVNAVEAWDARFIDCEFTFGGNSSGTIPGIEMTSPGGAGWDNTNQFVFTNCRFESFPGTAISMSGSNTNEIFFTNTKIEGTASSQPFVVINGAVNVNLGVMQMTCGGTGTLPSFLKITNANIVTGTVSMERSGSAKAVTQYVDIATSNRLDLLFAIYGGPEPTSGQIINVDAATLATSRLRVMSSLTSSWYLKGLLNHYSDAVDGTVTVAASRALTPADNGKTMEITSPGVSLTANGAALGDFGCTVIPNGTTSVVSAGGTLLNGATTTLTRTDAANDVFGILARASAVNSFKVTGA